jgi:hypothetical protein
MIMPLLRRTIIIANWMLFTIVVVGATEDLLVITDYFGICSRLLAFYPGAFNLVTFAALFSAGTAVAAIGWCGKLPGCCAVDGGA